MIATGTWFNEHSLTVVLVLGPGAAAALAVPTITRPEVRTRAGGGRTPADHRQLADGGRNRALDCVVSTLLGSRVELARALDMAEQSVELRSQRARLQQVTRTTRAGIPLSEALRDHQAITATGCALIAVGEKTGKMAQMLQSLAKLYQQSGRERAKHTLQLIEPLAILLIGGVIGLIIIGVVLAITASQELGLQES